jgi:hypothetical protein
MIKNFKIFENSIYSSLKYLLENDDISEEKIDKIVGFNSKNYSLIVLNNDDFTLSFKESFLDDFVNVEDGVFRYYLQIYSYYGNYEYSIDESELEYLNHYLDDNNIELLNKLSELLKSDIDDSNDVSILILALGKNIDTDYILYEIGYANEQVVKEEVNNALKKLPFDISYSHGSSWDIDIDLSIGKIVEYIDKNKLEDINTVAEFIKSVDYSDFSYDVENVWESEIKPDYKEVNKKLKVELENVIEDLEESSKLTKPDPNQLSLFGDFKDVEAKYNFNSEIFSKLSIDDLSYAKDVGGKLLAWFKSYIFQKKYMNDSNKNDNKLYKYKKLKEEGILNPDIDDEYGYIESVEKYNL